MKWIVEAETLSDVINGRFTIETKPLVMCKDCKWCVEHYDTDGNVPYWVCKNWDGGTDADGYCYEAERISSDDPKVDRLQRLAEKVVNDIS